MDEQCIFCRIVAGEIPAEKVYEDDKMIAIKDVNPVAPCHLLLLPKEHSESLLEVSGEVSGHMIGQIPSIAKRLGLAEKGFRVVVNTGQAGGQTVNHLHFHLLGERNMQWPPG